MHPKTVSLRDVDRDEDTRVVEMTRPARLHCIEDNFYKIQRIKHNKNLAGKWTKTSLRNDDGDDSKKTSV